MAQIRCIQMQMLANHQGRQAPDPLIEGYIGVVAALEHLKKHEIVISESTMRQIGGLFELADAGLQQLKGFAAPQRAWRVLAENRALGRFEALRSRNAPLRGPY